jgi:ribokinase
LVVELVSGAINWDTSVFVDKFPEPKEEVKAKKVMGVPGGKGANVAIASVRILGPNRVGLIGALGHDEIAERQLRILNEEGIDTSSVKRIRNANSGQAYVIIDDTGENFIITHKAANHMITANMINEEVTLNAIGGCNVITVIDPPLEVAQAIIMQGRNCNKTVIWSPALLVRNGFERLEDTLFKVDYIILNESEARILINTEDAMKACVMLSERMKGKKVVGTLGSKGCLFCSDGKVAKVPTPNPFDLGMRVVNTVGAGDAFLGAFSALRAKSYDDIEALFMANIAGALKTTKEETRGSPNYEEIKRFFEDRRVKPLFKMISFY